MKFALYGKTYDAADLDLVTLRDILLFEQQTKDMGREVSWAQIGVWGDEMEALKTNDEKFAHPGSVWLTAVTIWATRRLAGEDLTFEQAVDFPMRELEFVNEPAAKGSAAKANPTKRPRPRPVSVPANDNVPEPTVDTSSLTT